MISASTFSDTPPQQPANVSPQNGDVLEGLLAKLGHVLAGGSGAAVVSTTVAQTMPTLGFIALTDCVFAAATGLAGYTTTGLTGVSFPAGITLPFRLATWQLTSGSVLAIRA